jgi:uncharacterized protein YcbX
MEATQKILGSVVALWRYPVKSMMGEELNAAEVTSGGLLGDRAYALVDSADGKIASAKNPKKWPAMFDFRAALDGAPQIGAKLPPVVITLPDGTIVNSEQADINQILSQALRRNVTLKTTEHAHGSVSESASLDFESLEYGGTVNDFGLPEGTFFDGAILHLLTTATLDRLRALYPQGRFEARRFRPNLVVQSANVEMDFPENSWIGQTIAIGDAVRLSITRPCGRCVMTTLPQGDLPKDAGILRTIAQHSGANLGVYAAVVQGGQVRRGDTVGLE